METMKSKERTTITALVKTIKELNKEDRVKALYVLQGMILANGDKKDA